MSYRPRSINGEIRKAKDDIERSKRNVETAKADLARSEHDLTVDEENLARWLARKAEVAATEAEWLANGHKVTRGGYNSLGPPNPEPGDVHYFGTYAARWNGAGWERA